MNRTDESLMCDVQQGRLASFDELVSRYRGPLVRLTQSKLSDAVIAEDVVQETFLAVFAARQTYRPEFSFRTWLWTIALNLCKRQLRRIAMFPQTGELLQPEIEPRVLRKTCEQGSLQQLLQCERIEQLRLALEQFPEAQADALRLRFFGGLKFEEIAAAMDCSLSGAKLRVKLGLEKLADRLSIDEEEQS